MHEIQRKDFRDVGITTIEVYVDDMLVKSIKEKHHLKHLGEAFAIIKKVWHESEPKQMHIWYPMR